MSKWILLGLMMAVLLGGGCREADKESETSSSPKAMASGAVPETLADRQPAAEGSDQQQDGEHAAGDEPAEDGTGAQADEQPGGDAAAAEGASAEAAEAAGMDSGSETTSEMQPKTYRDILSDEDIGLLREALQIVAQQLPYTYNAETDTYHSEWLKAEGVSTEFLLNGMARFIDTNNLEVDERLAEKLAVGALEELRPQPKGEGPPAPPPPPERREPIKEPEEDEQSGRSKEFVVPRSIVGDWKSTQELHERYTIDKNDEHFEFYQFSDDGTAILSYFRQGRLSSRNEIPYRYDSRTGVLNLINAQGDVETTMTVKAPSGEEDTIYIKLAGKQATTVFSLKPIPPPGTGVAEEPGAGSGFTPDS